jgi:hypothetical protein
MGDGGAIDLDRRAVRKGVDATQAKAVIRPVNVVLYDDALRTHHVKRIGWRVICSECGSLERRKQRSFAVAEAHWHNQDHLRDGGVPIAAASQAVSPSGRAE